MNRVWFLGSLCALQLLSCNVLGGVISRHDKNGQMGYLRRFGYLSPTSASGVPDATVSEPTDSEMNEAVRHFQRMAHVTQTGAVNDATLRMMNTPRCGVPDVFRDDVSNRRKRYALLDNKWNKRVISYKIQNFTSDLSEFVQVAKLRHAFSIWRSASLLMFTRTRHSVADINIAFGQQEHGDDFPFDGRDGTLAHAFAPPNGDIHFDDDEVWTVCGRYGRDFLQVAVHEIGHALGLGHSEIKNSIMYPFYQSGLRNVKLHSDDMAGIQHIYRK